MFFIPKSIQTTEYDTEKRCLGPNVFEDSVAGLSWGRPRPSWVRVSKRESRNVKTDKKTKAPKRRGRGVGPCQKNKGDNA